MQHLSHAAKVALAFVAVAIPAVIASPAFQSFIEHHPADAIYVTSATGVIAAIVRAVKQKGA